jgi:hypothetical protein
MKLVRSHHEVAATNGSDARAETAEDVLRMACSFEFDAALLVTSRAIIAESRRSLASSWSERVNDKHDALLANSRATVADSKRMVAAVEAATAGAHKDEAIMMSIALATARAGDGSQPSHALGPCFSERVAVQLDRSQSKRRDSLGGERQRRNSKPVLMHFAPQ